MPQKKFSPMNLKKYTNAVNAERKLILQPAHMRQDNPFPNSPAGKYFPAGESLLGFGKGLVNGLDLG